MRQYPISVPDLVIQAKRLAEGLGFDLRPGGNRAGDVPAGPSCCIDEVGRLLMTFSESIVHGRIAEIGTGAGVGSAWIICGLRDTVQFVSVETDSALAAAAAELFADHNNVRIQNQDWRQSLPDVGPFDLVFADGGGVGTAGEDEWQSAAELLVPGGVMIIDDLTPEALWPREWRGRPDPKREFAFKSGLFTSTEIRSRMDVSTLILVRR